MKKEESLKNIGNRQPFKHYFTLSRGERLTQYCHFAANKTRQSNIQQTFTQQKLKTTKYTTTKDTACRTLKNGEKKRKLVETNFPLNKIKIKNQSCQVRFDMTCFASSVPPQKTHLPPSKTIHLATALSTFEVTTTLAQFGNSANTFCMS